MDEGSNPFARSNRNIDYGIRDLNPQVPLERELASVRGGLAPEILPVDPSSVVCNPRSDDPGRYGPARSSL